MIFLNKNTGSTLIILITILINYWEIFERNIIDSLDEICPIRKIQVSNSKPDWLNNEIIQLMLIKKLKGQEMTSTGEKQPFYEIE